MMNGNLVPKMQKEESFEYVDCRQSNMCDKSLEHKVEVTKDKLGLNFF